ncbi:Crp/Fnr family transcriptional regulator [Flavobacterium hydrophilum]|uniref:Crp/Fnr family transcriptional regulator n=1 Tax=Flavobacterium hydrophilum TaxID=2211445 RepID=A0A2V4CAA8_9FLAO|nr:Crp/Fnr family transcriptional regulator [Flavobacterium hydrophilum]PXY47073.1 Crp/Fnr family transcriptional regulator [Flavobacterium hydrophilum]
MIQFLRSLQIISESELEKLKDITKNKILQKNDYLIQEGNICNEIVLIKTGILRSFYRNSEGNEITKCIAFENELACAYSSFITQQPTFENIQAICNTEVIVLNRKDLYNLYENSQEWQKLGRLLTELEYIQLENRTVSFQKQTAQERYDTLINNHSKYLKYIPLKYLSSYLGITSRHLSRLRKTN